MGDEDIIYLTDDTETEMIENLYKLMKLEKSKQSVQERGLFSTEDVKAFFAQKHKKLPNVQKRNGSYEKVLDFVFIQNNVYSETIAYLKVCLRKWNGSPLKQN